ncbi:flagellin lysine-N-methylase [Clostridium sp.]|uniref:flagellin lysine-N-methylase n=1 Tax=Clostridium sp. TaxID=1506 RepID=UPI002A90CD30|nr:flagellin lysine-N-methylase [Clostridium sp.]MDY6012774.1 flagellin lysine-N-methylase [Clostridium sp.]
MSENIFKILNYDKFKCIADKCEFTCCKGWEINIDNSTYNKWKSENLDYLLEKVEVKDKKEVYFINKENHEDCPFLDKQGLCDIVKNHGEEYLSLTCHTFPRIENVFDDRRELSLSCSCKEVVEIISNLNKKINLSLENYIRINDDLSELRIREALIYIMQQENISLEYKLIICFEMLLSILENESFNKKEDLLEEIEKYRDRNYIQNIILTYKNIELDIYDSIEEVNNLFLDIIENYKEIPMFNDILSDISSFAEEFEIEDIEIKWNSYKEEFNRYNDLIENIIVSKIISNCVNDDIEEMIVSFELIILDYLLVRHATFLKYYIDEEKLYIKDIKNYIVAFSRIIQNNSDAVKEFLKDGFDDVILELGYLCFISLF